MKMKKYPSKEYLLECFMYLEETGELVWKKRPLKHFKNKHGKNTFNSKYSGRIAGSLAHGYLMVFKLYVHRIIYILYHGYYPTSLIDHIDGNKLNNKADNLREVSYSCNMRNSKLSTLNSSGIKGVTFCRRDKKWVAQIKVLYKNRFLGRYTHIHNAACARLAGEQCLGWSGCESSSPAFQYVKKMLKNNKKGL